jgi:lysophospholipase-2
MWAVENPEEKSEVPRDGLRQSIKDILRTIQSEEENIPRGKIFLGGISQGVATVLATMLAGSQGGFAGLLGLCSIR